jgi:hypothetical protein
VELPAAHGGQQLIVNPAIDRQVVIPLVIPNRSSSAFADYAIDFTVIITTGRELLLHLNGY